MPFGGGPSTTQRLTNGQAAADEAAWLAVVRSQAGSDATARHWLERRLFAAAPEAEASCTCGRVECSDGQGGCAENAGAVLIPVSTVLAAQGGRKTHAVRVLRKG